MRLRFRRIRTARPEPSDQLASAAYAHLSEDLFQVILHSVGGDEQPSAISAVERPAITSRQIWRSRVDIPYAASRPYQLIAGRRLDGDGNLGIVSTDQRARLQHRPLATGITEPSARIPLWVPNEHRPP